MQPKRGPTLADLMIIVAGVSASLGCLTLYLRLLGAYSNSVAAFGPDFPWAAAAFLIPLSWTLALLAMVRTRRRRWTSHPALVVGASIPAAMALDSFNVFNLVYGTGPIAASETLAIICLGFASSLCMDVAKPILGVLLLAALGGRLRRPQGWLEWAGVGVGLCWILLWLWPCLSLGGFL